MYVADTNVISELRKQRQGRAEPRVVAWAKSVEDTSLYVSVVSIMEMEIGVLMSERRDAALGRALRRWLETDVIPRFAGRILPIDMAVARKCAGLHSPNRKPDRDAFIAASALANGMTIVTRNEQDFTGMGVAVLNPWTYRVGLGGVTE